MYKTVLFDIDGTLIDSEQYLLSALSLSLKQVLNLSYDNDKLKDIIGLPEDEVAKKFSDDIEKQKQLMISWTKNVALIKYPPLLFDNVLETLLLLKNKGFKLGIVTSKTKLHMKNDFDKLNINSLFDIIITSDMVKKSKPNAEPILLALKKCNSNIKDTIYIGDTLYDYLCAQNANVHFGLAKWGSKLKSIDCKNSTIIENFKKIIDIVE